MPAKTAPRSTDRIRHFTTATWWRLGSAQRITRSPRRRKLLRKVVSRFRVIESGVPEPAPRAGVSVRTYVKNLARKKALAVARNVPAGVVLGADTVVSLGGEHFGKPSSLEEAEAMLRALAGRVHQVATGMCLVQRAGRWRRLVAETTAVTFRPLGRREIRRYLRATSPLDKAGGYAIQDQGESIVASIEGSYSNVVGLPVERLKEELARIAGGD